MFFFNFQDTISDKDLTGNLLSDLTNFEDSQVVYIHDCKQITIDFDSTANSFDE